MIINFACCDQWSKPREQTVPNVVIKEVNLENCPSCCDQWSEPREQHEGKQGHKQTAEKVQVTEYKYNIVILVLMW